MKKLSLVKNSLTLLSSLIVVLAPASAFAARPAHAGGGNGGGGGGSTSTILTGNDISWPQCGHKLPSGQAFGIVGVNGGLANTTNPCLADQLAWAANSKGGTGQPNAALYVNTANPGDVKDQIIDWPNSGSSLKYGTCTGANDQACAYQYGWDRAYDDAQIRGVSNPAAYKWWLDVETGNTWSTVNLGNNVADLEGMVDYFTSIGVTSVGIYSTAYQWGQIVGSSVSSTSSLNGLESWLAGASGLADAQAMCHEAPLTDGGLVTLAQYVSKRTDYDFSCV
jgi:hypothetical protein